MSFTQSISSVFRQYFVFSGRASRSESWWFALSQIIAAIVLAIAVPILYLVYVVATIVPALAVLVRRLHDTGRSAWWLLFVVVPFGTIVLLIFALIPGQPGENKYGSDPLRPPAAGPFEGLEATLGSQGEARKCAECGSELEPGANYCRSCGTGT